MTEQIDFYILEDSSGAVKQQTACRIIHKAYSQGLTVFVRTSDIDEGNAVDGLLWSFSQGSFIPHCIAENTLKDWKDYPVQIGVGDISGQPSDILMNLNGEISEQNFAHSRIIELVCGADQDRQAGRGRFRTYKEKGYEPNTHKL